MVIEHIRYDVPSDRQEEFEAAWERARSVLDGSSHCLAYEVSHGVEEPNHYTVRIEWDSLEGHQQGFRESAEFNEFFQAVRPFFDQIREMRHYRRTSIASTDE